MRTIYVYVDNVINFRSFAALNGAKTDYELFTQAFECTLSMLDCIVLW